QEVRAEETAGLLLGDDDVVRLRRDLVDDLIAAALGPGHEGMLVGPGVLPGPAAGVPVVRTADARGVDDGHPLGVGDLDQLPDPRHTVPRLGAAGVAPALDRFQNRLSPVPAEVVVD